MLRGTTPLREQRKDQVEPKGRSGAGTNRAVTVPASMQKPAREVLRVGHGLYAPGVRGEFARPPKEIGAIARLGVHDAAELPSGGPHKRSRGQHNCRTVRADTRSENVRQDSKQGGTTAAVRPGQ
jgi:hypothetical protein